MTIEVLQQTFNYVTNVPYFWITMGMTSAVSIFVGAIIFDGDLTTAGKGVVGVLSYIFFLFYTQFTRALNTLKRLGSQHEFQYMGYASSMTILIISFFWLIGVLIGVIVSHLIRRVYRKY